MTRQYACWRLAEFGQDGPGKGVRSREGEALVALAPWTDTSTTALGWCRPSCGRQGFTLLEVMLAVAISLLLFGALYVALDVQLRHVQAGREAIEDSVLARSLLLRMSNDVAASLGSLPPPPRGKASGSTAPDGMAPSMTGPVQFNYGLQGEPDRLVLFVSRYPREMSLIAPPDGSASSMLTSDLRRVTYWLAGGSANPLGLARQEIKLATDAEQLAELPPDVDEESSFVIAEEVRFLEFHYFDGTSWVDGWDGSIRDHPRQPMRGPPLAVAIRLGVVPAGRRTRFDDPGIGESELKYYRHVVAVPTAQTNWDLNREP